MAERQTALGLLKTPHVSSFITLNKPFLIWQMPRPQTDIFRDLHVEPHNSSVEVLVDIISGSNNTHFIFYFLWRNDTDFAAVVNISSSLIFNGSCFVQAKPGFFSGDSADLNINASLSVMRWFGWGTDPVTGNSLDQTLHPNSQSTQFKSVVNLHVHGGHIFESADSDSQNLVFEGVPLRRDLLVVPARASILLRVSADFFYRFDGGGDIQDRITADFATNGRGIFCPDLVFEVLTPLPNLVVGAPQMAGLSSSTI